MCSKVERPSLRPEFRLRLAFYLTAIFPAVGQPSQATAPNFTIARIRSADLANLVALDKKALDLQRDIQRSPAGTWASFRKELEGQLKIAEMLDQALDEAWGHISYSRWFPSFAKAVVTGLDPSVPYLHFDLGSNGV